MYERRNIKVGSLIVALVGVFVMLLITVQPIYADAKTTDETTATVTFNPGDIDLSQVPAFDFGTQDISATEVSHLSTTATPVIITDLRGNGAGWKLNVSLSEFSCGEDQEGEALASLLGSYITIDDAVTEAINGTNASEPANSDSIQINSDGSETTIWGAATDHGLGVWQLEWLANDATLTVLPGTARATVNTATLTWTLQDTP